MKSSKIGARVKECAKKIKALDLDSLLISNPFNITYLSGFRPAEGYLLITRQEEIVYFTNFLYQEEAKKIDLWKTIASNGNIFELIKTESKHLHLKKIGFESKHLPFLEYKTIEETLSSEGIDFIRTTDLLEKIRARKTKDEISLIKKSIKITAEAFEFIREIYDPTMTEKDLSIEIEKFLKLKSDNAIAFPPIVASGENSAFPHYAAREKKLDISFCLIDLGSRYCGYCADLTRIFFWSKMPLQLKRVYDIVKGAQARAIKKIKEGVRVKDIDCAARELIDKKGLGKYFGHGTGHGIGLSVHEMPFINSRNDEILKEGMVITVEPAVYLVGKFGVRIEDMVLVKKEKGELLSGDIHF